MALFSNMQLTRTVVGIGVLAAFALSGGVSWAQDMGPIFAKTRDVPGWERLEDSWKVANNKDLTPMFNGGYQIYLDFGLMTVAAYTYEIPGTQDRITMTAHFFPKVDNARSYFSYLASSIPDDAKDLKISETAFSYSSAGVYQSYALADRYLATFICSGDSEEMRDASLILVDNLTSKIRGWTYGLQPSFVLPREGRIRYTYTCAISEPAIKHVYPMLAGSKLDENDEINIANADGAKYGDPFNCDLVIINCSGDEAGAEKAHKAIADSAQDKLVEDDEELSLHVYNNESKGTFWAARRHKTNVLVAYGAAGADEAKALVEAAVDHLEKGPEDEGEGES